MLSLKRFSITLPLLVFLLAANVGLASANEIDLEQRRPEAQTTLQSVSKEVMCPTCDAPLDVSNSPSADQMRTWIVAAVEAGWTKAEIKEGLIEEYDGDESILAVPRAGGAGIAVWLVPISIVLMAFGIGYSSLRSWRNAGKKD